MVEAVIRMLRSLSWLFAVLVFPSLGCAHRLDEYLQATLVDVEPDSVRLQINLTPGVAVAERVLFVVDSDSDGVISTNEAAAYAELLERDLTLRLDGLPLELRSMASEFPAPEDLRSGWGIIQIELLAVPGSLAAGAHALTLKNRHMTPMSVYLFNAVRPRSGSIQIASQKRNESQSEGEIEFVFHPPANLSRAFMIGASVSGLVAALLAGAWWSARRWARPA